MATGDTARPGQDQGTALERAHGGTVFLDEIDAMDLPTQARLAATLREHKLSRQDNGRMLPIDVRLVAASDRDLSSKVQSGTFHEDLLALLALGTIPVPPLRERLEDIPLLADHFLKRHARQMNRGARRLSGDALRALVRYRWPGNIRELSNVIERAVMLSQDEELKDDLFPFLAAERLDAEDLALVTVEKRAIEAALAYCEYKKGKAAQVLGISWPTLNKKISDYGIELPPRGAAR
ncbi:MAG: sigma 54-interacting transcriptional regulator [Planctomycetota bacterium]